MSCTPLQFIASIESTLEETLAKRAVFAGKGLCLNRVFQFHEDAAYLRLQSMGDADVPPELVATVAVHAVSGENGFQAMQGACSHVALDRKTSFFFTQPQSDASKKKLTEILQALFDEAEAQEKAQSQLESDEGSSKNALDASKEAEE